MNVEDELYEVQSSDVQFPESGDRTAKRAKLTAYEIEGRKMLALERLADEQRTANLIAFAHDNGWAQWRLDEVRLTEVVARRLGVVSI